MASILATFGVIAGIIILGYIAEIIFKRTGIPDVLILIGTGITINAVDWVDPSTFGLGAQLFATFTLVFLLFQGSLNIEFKTIFASFRSVMTLTFLNFVLTVLIGTLIAHFLMGFSFMLALLLSMILGGTSSAVIIPLVNNLKSIHKKQGLILTLESAISDVFCIIGAITVITIATTGEVVGADIFKNILSSFALALVVGAAIGLIWINMVKKSIHLKKAYMVTIAVVMATYALVESPLVGASGAIAALAFGLMIGNSKSIIKSIELANGETENPVISSVLSPSAKNFYAEISFFVKVFFFVYLGILMDFSNPSIYIWSGILTAAFYFIARPLAVKKSFKTLELDMKTKNALEVMIPKGLAAAVLAQLAVSSGMEGAATIVPIILGVVLISILLTSVLIFLSERGWYRGLLKAGENIIYDEEGNVIKKEPLSEEKKKAAKEKKKAAKTTHHKKKK